MKVVIVDNRLLSFQNNNIAMVDYTCVGVTSKGTTKILPSPDPKQTQKFAVGDHDGILHVHGIKKGELQLYLKTLPGPKIRRMALGGTLGTLRDKIFVAFGNSVKGFTTKGKMFLAFDTNLIEPISAMYVLGPDLAACARDLYHRYQNCKDADSYLAGEALYDVVLLPLDGLSVVAILACADRAVRVLYGTKSPTVLRLPSVPTVLAVYREGDRDAVDRALVGTIDGKIGLLILEGKKTLRITWLVNTSGSEITCLDTFELDDGLDILVGRQDGTVDVYAFPDDEDTTPTLKFRFNAGESISSIGGGFIGSVDHPEVLVTTYSGRIFGLTTRPPGSIEAELNEGGIAKVKSEIEELEQKLRENKEVPEEDNNSLTPLMLSVSHRMILDRESASYLLSIELDTSIDNILIQSDTPIELIDECNNAVVSFSTCNPEEGNFVLATFRCQSNTNRLETRLQTVEGQSGTLQVYVTSQIQPKCCRRIRLPIYALSLHARLHEEETEKLSTGPYNELRLIGGFTVAEMHAWLSLALPDIPERSQLIDGEASLNYISTFVGTILKCKYKKGSATFLGENVSTIIILRDILTREATKRKTKLEVFCDVAEGSVARVLELIIPRLEDAHIVCEKIKILDALQALDMRENPHENLCTQWQELIKDENLIRSQAGKGADTLQRLHGVVTDLYVDWERAKGSRRISSRVAAEKLKSALESRDLTLLLQVLLGKEENIVSSVPAVNSGNE